MKGARALRTSAIDESSHGFDNVTVENLTVLMKKYLTAAQKMGRLAIGRLVKSVGR